MLNLERIKKLKGLIAEAKGEKSPETAEKTVSAANNASEINNDVLNKLNPKWKKLLEANKDLDIAQYINSNTQYDDFGLPIVDFDKKEEANGLPQISQFGIQE